MPTLLLAGDVMLGRGIDQILQQPLTPEIYEPFCKSALDYVALAERRSGPIPRQVGCDYVWGDALEDFRRADLRIVNLETAITCCDVPAPKGINYRCHPANLGCLTAAGVDCCVLANNHVLDWGEDGLIETLHALDAAGLKRAGAGIDIAEAAAPAILPRPDGGRLLVNALGSPSSGVPPSWAAGPGKPGVHFLTDPDQALDHLRGRIGAEKRGGDLVLVSIHWGPNWGYDIPDEDQRFARRLIDEAGVDVVHGHSSHHPKAIEIHHGRPILYGCGDFLNDYEGISGHESYQPDLVLAYRITLDPQGRCSSIELLPFRIAKFRLQRASGGEAEWLAATMDREGRRFGGAVDVEDGMLRLSAPAEVHW
jgi:poly-gamma-glutamate synthesis protein (capsule biosynthesis protein)